MGGGCLGAGVRGLARGPWASSICLGWGGSSFCLGGVLGAEVGRGGAVRGCPEIFSWSFCPKAGVVLRFAGVSSAPPLVGWGAVAVEEVVWGGGGGHPYLADPHPLSGGLWRAPLAWGGGRGGRGPAPLWGGFMGLLVGEQELKRGCVGGWV